MFDSRDDSDFARLTRMASAGFDVPMSAIGVPDGSGVAYRAPHGAKFGAAAEEDTFCAHLLESGDGPLVVKDAARDARFADSAFAAGKGVRFYAGAPIVAHDQPVGTLCVFDIVPHAVVPAGSLEQLTELANLAGSLVELKDEAQVRTRTAAELIKEEWRHALTLEAGKVGSWVWDIRSGEVSGNDIFRRMFGIEPLAGISIDDVFAAVLPEDRPNLDRALAESFDKGVDFVSEFRVVSGRWLIARGRVYQRDASGQPLVMMGVNIDITDARQAADHTRHLLRELNHRVKNTLAMIQSLARQTIRRSPSPQEFIEAFSGRLQTLSEAHALLSDRDWSGIGLVELIEAQVEPYLLGDGTQLELQGTDLQLPPDHALGLGLILHELCSNAVRHGALATPAGSVRIAWEQERGERLVLKWRESGGPPVAPPQETGFGAQLIRRSLDKIVDSRVLLEFPRGGVTARIELPLS